MLHRVICLSIFLSLFLFAVDFVFASDKSPISWTPKVEFQLEDSDSKGTISWISGWAYAMTEVGRNSAHGTPKSSFCLPQHGYIESRVLLNILNSRYKGKRVTSEQASKTLWTGVRSHYRCQKRNGGQHS